MKKERDEYVYLYDKHINTAFSHIKAEAYKECIEKVKEKNRSVGILRQGDLDNIVKELEGEDNDK